MMNTPRIAIILIPSNNISKIMILLFQISRIKLRLRWLSHFNLLPKQLFIRQVWNIFRLDGPESAVLAFIKEQRLKFQVQIFWKVLKLNWRALEWSFQAKNVCASLPVVDFFDTSS
jgi:hypothetical protein